MKIRSSVTAAVFAIAAIGLSSPVIATADAVDDLITADYESAQWALTAVRASDAWATATGDGVVVAVLDTGADAQHPDLDGQLVDGSYTYLVYDEETGEGTAVTDPVAAGDSTDYYGHGTHVSGIIAAENNDAGITGLAYDAQIMPVQLNLDVWSTAEFAEVLDDAIRYAVDNGADVINMSLGTDALNDWGWETDPDIIAENEALFAAEQKICDAITYAADNDVIVVSASGNSYSMGNPLSIPAYCEDGISVGSVNPNFTVPSYYSSQDATLDVMAPGESVISTFPTEIDGEQTPYAEFPYLEMSGTSMASPMVAAAAALWLENYSGSDPVADFYTDLTETAKDLMSIEGFDPYTGYGLLDAYALVDDSATAHSFATVPYLRLVGAGPTNNLSNGFTAVWDAPLASVLPNNYTLEIFENGQDEAVLSQTIPGTEVRTAFEAIETDNSAYLVLTANYDASSVSTPPLLYSLGNGGGGGNVELDSISGLDGSLSRGELRLNWDEYTDLDADAIAVWAYGGGIGTEEFIYPEDGQFPTSVNLNLQGTDPANSDASVFVFAIDFDSYSESDWSTLEFSARVPAAVSSMEMFAPNAMSVGVQPNTLMGCSWELIGDDEEFGEISTCAGKKVMYGVKVVYESTSGSLKTFSAPGVSGYMSYWGSAVLDAIYIQPRRGFTPVQIVLNPLNDKGRILAAGSAVVLPIYEPFVR